MTHTVHMINESDITISKKRFAMFGEFIDITIYDIDKEFTEPLIIEIYAEGLRLQKIFNFYDPGSELSILNNKRSMKVSEELLYVIKEALKYSLMTEGLYDVSIGKKIKARKSGRELNISCTYKDIVIDENKIILNNNDLMIDLGSIAKGYIVDKLVEFMKSLGIISGFIDARGDMKIFGEFAEIIDIQHPRISDSAIGAIRFDNMSMATSGDYNQYYGKYDNNHIIGTKNTISVTVIAKELAEADAIATCLMVMNDNEIEEFLKKYNFKALVIDKNLNIKTYNGFEKHYYEQEDQQEYAKETYKPAKEIYNYKKENTKENNNKDTHSKYFEVKN